MVSFKKTTCFSVYVTWVLNQPLNTQEKHTKWPKWLLGVTLPIDHPDAAHRDPELADGPLRAPVAPDLVPQGEDGVLMFNGFEAACFFEKMLEMSVFHFFDKRYCFMVFSNSSWPSSSFMLTEVIFVGVRF